MKLLMCPVCHDVLGLLGQVWRKCICGASGGQYNEDLVTATMGGQARVFGVANPFFNPFYVYLTEEQKKRMRKDNGYGGASFETDCWWGEYPGDVQLFRIKSPDGPRLKIRITPQPDGQNLLKIVDKRPFTIDGRELKEVTAPANPGPALRQLLKERDKLVAKLKRIQRRGRERLKQE